MMIRSLKMAVAIGALGAASFAIAQGNPPTTSSPNPATGAGQQTQQNTPMGTTGTPATPGTSTRSGATSAMPNQGMNSPSTSANSAAPMPAAPMRTARADRS